MTISRQLESAELFTWMNDKSHADGQSTGYAVPDFFAVLTVSLPRKFLHYSLQAYMLGLTIYLAFLWRDSVGDEAPGDNRRIFITTIVSLAICWAIFLVSDISNRCKGSVWDQNLKEVERIQQGTGKARIVIGVQDWEPEKS
ncbi:hypothetical protein BKA64DRAFT_659440 [Cadophora sp. MPI-SDFR-AT-0126]|nr:hypothetical protein BKA64DRAFT_659440 [Leotiomycetes sp. MPI-SDFR-AT-0126]